MDSTQEPQVAHGRQDWQSPYPEPASLRGKTVFITGAASGLGAALATVLACAGAGADIVATDLRPT